MCKNQNYTSPVVQSSSPVQYSSPVISNTQNKMDRSLFESEIALLEKSIIQTFQTQQNDIIQYIKGIDILLLNLSPDIDPGTWPQKDIHHTLFPLVGLCFQLHTYRKHCITRKLVSWYLSLLMMYTDEYLYRLHLGEYHLLMH